MPGKSGSRKRKHRSVGRKSSGVSSRKSKRARTYKRRSRGVKGLAKRIGNRIAKRRRSKRFESKVLKVISKSQKQRTYHCKLVAEQLSITSGEQAAASYRTGDGDWWRTIVANMALETPAIVPTDSFELNVRSLVATYSIRNLTNTPVWLDIYKCKPRIDTSDVTGSPTFNTWNAALAFSTGYDALNGTVNGYRTLSVTPYESERFTSTFKVTKKKSKLIPVGGLMFYRNKIKNKHVQYPRFSNADAIHLKKISTEDLFIIRGVPGLSTGGSVVTFGSAKVAIACNVVCKIRNDTDFISDKTRSFVVGTAWSTATDVRFMDYRVGAQASDAGGITTQLAV